MNYPKELAHKLRHTGCLSEVELADLLTDAADLLDRVQYMMTLIIVEQDLPGYLMDRAAEILQDPTQIG